MAALTDLETRVNADENWRRSYLDNLPNCQSCAMGMYLIHVHAVTSTTSSGGNSFIDLLTTAPHHLPTSDRPDARDNTRMTEDAYNLGRSLYFYGGRAYPGVGGVAMAFPATCEHAHTGSATPFDTGGMFKKKIRLEESKNTSDGRRDFVRDSLIDLDRWRSDFARYLAAYFTPPSQYWYGRPSRHDPDGVFGNPLNEWRSWAFEVRFREGHNVNDRAAWCASPNLYQSILDAVDAMPLDGSETPLMQFLSQSEELAPGIGSDDYAAMMELWVLNQLNA